MLLILLSLEKHPKAVIVHNAYKFSEGKVKLRKYTQVEEITYYKLEIKLIIQNMGNNGLYKTNKTVIQLAIKTKKNKNN